MRVKSENGVVFAGETKQTSTLSVGSWLLLLGLVFKSADECEQKKAKKNEKSRLLSLLSSSDVFGGCQLCTKED